MRILFVIHLLASFYASYWILEKVSFASDTAGSAVVAFFLSFTVIWFLLSVFRRRYFKLVIQLMRLFKFFIKDFIRANVRLTKEIVTPKINLQPAVVKVPLSLHSDTSIMVLTNMSNLTPGTLVVGVSDDKRYLFVHTIYLNGGTLEGFKSYMKEGLEKRLLDVTALSASPESVGASGGGDNESIKKIKKTKE
ncbi:Na+/H+ antiporter subunit E [Olivibacter sp. XZL3]|uniref:Na+/H+ antiporter subunit E n=1 Tax=Olivibacter sp. XZL3 TaxID=1735116 RepID=UPI00106511AC|nr:Na+/H+ antiporter subunit E [Olivibacter sp. XZL3]